MARETRQKQTQASTIDIASLTCPRCKQGHLITGSRGWGCARWREGCRFVVWFETAGTRLTTPQLHALITSGKTRKATFIDGTGKSISARLVLDPSRDGGARVEPA